MPAETAPARLFIAVWPPEEVRRRLLSALDALRTPPPPGTGPPAARWVEPGRWHVTLRFLGTCAPDEARRRLDGVAWPPATAVLGPRPSLLGPSVLQVPVAGLEALATSVAQATAGLGRPPDFSTFVGHLTVARAGRRDGALAALARRGRDIELAERFVVRAIALVASETAPDGARYRTLHEWSIPPRPELSC